MFNLALKQIVLVAQSFLTLCNPRNCSPPGSSVHGILQAGILEQIAIPFSRGSSQPRDQIQVSVLLNKRVKLKQQNALSSPTTLGTV